MILEKGKNPKRMWLRKIKGKENNRKKRKKRKKRHRTE